MNNSNPLFVSILVKSGRIRMSALVYENVKLAEIVVEFEKGVVS